MLKVDLAALDYFKLFKQKLRPEAAAGPAPLRVALLGDCATQQLAIVMRALLSKNGVSAIVHEGEYDTIQLEAFNASSALYQFQPDVLVLLHSIGTLKRRYHDTEDRTSFVDTIMGELTATWDAVARHSRALVVQSTYVTPHERLFGNFDNKVETSLYTIVRGLNAEMARRARERKQVFICDVDYLASWVGRQSFLDERLWTLAKAPCALDYLPLVAQSIIDVILSTRGLGIKCVVLDLDNTLWGGVIGDDGVEGIRIGDLGDGEAYRSFQLYLRELKRRGLLIAVCSKNDYVNAIRPFREHPEMVLKEQDIAIFVANWESKVDNLRAIQSALNIGFDAMLFLDDSAFERNLVRSFLPEVVVPELPEDPADYVKTLSALNLFETSTCSQADVLRTDQYREQALREVERARFGSIDDYLRSLEMKVTLARFDAFHLPRIAQLIQRSNQFNLTTRRYLETECESMMRDREHYFPFWMSLKDRFGDYGLILVAICRLLPEELEIDTFLMSCRVLQRGVEQYAMNHIFELARRRGAHRVVGRYLPTAKNDMVRTFYSGLGFQQASEDPGGGSTWVKETAADVARPVLLERLQGERPEEASAG